MKFSDWLRKSNEAKPFRDAFSLIDEMPTDFGLRMACWSECQRRAENAWEQTKRELQL